MDNGTKLSPNMHTADKWNDELTSELVGDIVCLAIYLFIGGIGNALIVCTYVKRPRLNNEDRFFIPVLAIIDLVACVVNCSFSISINLLPVKYNSDIACKFMWFLAMLTTGNSAFTLMLIAVHRYLKLCKPYRRQITHKWKKILLAIIVSAMVVIALPCFAFYGSAEVKHPATDLIGLRCTSVTAGLPKVALVYKVVLFLIIFGILIVLVVLYSLIGKVLFKQARFSWKLNFTKEMTSATSDSGTGETDDETRKSSHNHVTRESLGENVPHSHSGDNRQSTTADLRLQKHRSPGYRVTIMFMIIAGVFVICFIPKLTMMVLESRNPDFWLSLTPSELGGYRFLYTFFIVNFVTNAFVYGFMDRKFQTEFKKWIFRRA